MWRIISNFKKVLKYLSPDRGEKENVMSMTPPTYDEPDFYDVTSGTGLHSTDVNRPLPRWLRDNVESARFRLTKSEPIRYEVERLQVGAC